MWRGLGWAVASVTDAATTNKEKRFLIFIIACFWLDTDSYGEFNVFPLDNGIFSLKTPHPNGYKKRVHRNDAPFII